MSNIKPAYIVVACQTKTLAEIGLLQEQYERVYISNNVDLTERWNLEALPAGGCIYYMKHSSLSNLPSSIEIAKINDTRALVDHNLVIIPASCVQDEDRVGFLKILQE